MAENQTPDPYDLGDTDLRLAHPAPAKPAAAPEASLDAVGSVRQPAETSPPPAVPPRDPATGRFLKQEEAPAPPPAPPKSPHPAWLVQQAKNFGFDDEEITQTPTDLLQRQVFRAHQQQAELREQQARVKALEQPQNWRMEEAGKPATPPEPDTVEGVNADDLHPALVQIIRGLTSRFEKRIAALESQVGQVRNVQEQTAALSQGQLLDRAILQYADSAAVGQGAITSLQPKTPEFECRLSIWDKAKRLAGEKADFGACLKAIPQAVSLLRMNKPPEAPQRPQEPAKPTNGHFTPEEWQDAALAQPTHRNGAHEPKGEALAVGNLDRKMREAGINTQSADNEILETLL